MPRKPASRLSAPLEDYLEAIQHLQTRHRVARAKEIAQRLGVSRASVTSALKALGNHGLINYEPYSYVTLTAQGEKVAAEIIRRHEILREFFEDFLKMEPERAESNACRVEHVMDSVAMERLVSFLEFIRQCPRTGQDWLQAFERFCDTEMDPSRCPDCMRTLSQNH